MSLWQKNSHGEGLVYLFQEVAAHRRKGVALVTGQVPSKGVAVSQENDKDENTGYQENGEGGGAPINHGAALKLFPQAHVRLSSGGILTAFW
jgi:hypothetical protein